MIYIHIRNILRGTEHKTDHIRKRIGITAHFIYHKASGCKITGYVELLRLSEHHSRHQLIHMASPVAEAGMMLMCISGIHHIGSLFNPLKQLSHFVRRCLSIIIQTHDNVSCHIMKARHQRTVLSEILCKINPLTLCLRMVSGGCTQLFNCCKGVIRRTVIYHNNLITIILHGGHCIINFFYHMRQCLCRTVTGNYKTDLLHFYCLRFSLH